MKEAGSTLHYCVTPALHVSNACFLPAAFAPGSLFVSASFVLVVALADLLFDFLGHEIDGGVEVGFKILSVKIRAGHVKEHGALELAVRRLGCIMFKDHTGIDCETVQACQLIEARNNVVLDGLGERHVVWRNNQFHQP